MEQVLASPASLFRHLLVGRDDRVANCALILSLERTRHVFAEDREAVRYGTVL